MEPGSTPSEASPAAFALRVAEGGNERVYPLGFARTRVGRSPHVDVEIHDRFAARQHFVLDWSEAAGRHEILVWGRNGLTLNGAVLWGEQAPRALAPGDELRIGNTVLRYERDPTAEARRALASGLEEGSEQVLAAARRELLRRGLA